MTPLKTAIYLSHFRKSAGVRRGYRASALLAPGLGDPALLTVLFLLCGFRLFGFLLPISFGLVLLAFLVAHGVTPFWCSPLHFAARAISGHLLPWALLSMPGTTHWLMRRELPSGAIEAR